jgi:wobble nucleotide-excising tRNase
MNIIKIKYNNIEGVLNIDTNVVQFYHFKYNGIEEAIKHVEQDIENHKDEIEIFDNLMKDLAIF